MQTHPRPAHLQRVAVDDSRRSRDRRTRRSLRERIAHRTHAAAEPVRRALRRRSDGALEGVEMPPHRALRIDPVRWRDGRECSHRDRGEHQSPHRAPSAPSHASHPGPFQRTLSTPSASRPAIATVLARRPYTPPPRGRDSRGNRRRPLSSPRERTARRRRRPHHHQGCALVRTCARGQSSARARRRGGAVPQASTPASLSKRTKEAVVLIGSTV